MSEKAKSQKRSFLLVFWIATTMSFTVNFLISAYQYHDYFHHELGYYVGSFLASSTIGAIMAVIVIMAWKKHHVSN